MATDWRMRERTKTAAAAILVCLNIGVDPPDVYKTDPCAKLECWTDPLAMPSNKALDQIGRNLQAQYEAWQGRARYKVSLDPTAEETKKILLATRRTAKEDRVLFHYNGHGVPRPTKNGELWVFNKTYTQYIPLCLYDLQQWIGSPSISVFDCNYAGSLLTFGESHNEEDIYLAACAADETLPMHPDVPADLFTSCLTTPIEMMISSTLISFKASILPLDLHVPGGGAPLLIPGKINDRRSPLGELYWLLTAISDTIAWNKSNFCFLFCFALVHQIVSSLSRDLFRKLFRQDLLVAALFRNFILAHRVMRAFGVKPQSRPSLPSSIFEDDLWQSWELAIERCLAQLPGLLNGTIVITPPLAPGQTLYEFSDFFEQQLTAFEVLVDVYKEDEQLSPPQLPILLQVLLSQTHRARALYLLCRFIDLGKACVGHALQVGIHPYICKLLLSKTKELRPFLCFCWARLVGHEPSVLHELCVKDKEGGDPSWHYFLCPWSEEEELVKDQSEDKEETKDKGADDKGDASEDAHRLSHLSMEATSTACLFILVQVVLYDPTAALTILSRFSLAKFAILFNTCWDEQKVWTLNLLSVLWRTREGRGKAVAEGLLDLVLEQLLERDQNVKCATIHALALFVSGEDKSSLERQILLHCLRECVGGSPQVRKSFLFLLSLFAHNKASPNFVLLVRAGVRSRREEHKLESPVSPKDSGRMARLANWVALGLSDGRPSSKSGGIRIEEATESPSRGSSVYGSSTGQLFDRLWRFVLSCALEQDKDIVDLSHRLLLQVSEAIEAMHPGSALSISSQDTYLAPDSFLSEETETLPSPTDLRNLAFEPPKPAPSKPGGIALSLLQASTVQPSQSTQSLPLARSLSFTLHLRDRLSNTPRPHSAIERSREKSRQSPREPIFGSSVLLNVSPVESSRVKEMTFLPNEQEDKEKEIRSFAADDWLDQSRKYYLRSVFRRHQ